MSLPEFFCHKLFEMISPSYTKLILRPVLRPAKTYWKKSNWQILPKKKDAYHEQVSGQWVKTIETIIFELVFKPAWADRIFSSLFHSIYLIGNRVLVPKSPREFKLIKSDLYYLSYSHQLAHFLPFNQSREKYLFPGLKIHPRYRMIEWCAAFPKFTHSSV